MVWFGIILLTLVLVVFINAAEKVKYGEFDQVSWWLIPLGIYHWGQAIVLAGFWCLYGVLAMFLFSPAIALRVYLTFLVFRSVTEIWLVSKHSYTGLLPLFSAHSEQIKEEQILQLYVLSHAVAATIAFLFI